LSLRVELRRFLVEEVLFGEPVSEKEFGDDADLFELGLDSMAILRTTAFLEKQLGRPIPPESLTTAHFRSLRTLVEHAESLSG